MNYLFVIPDSAFILIVIWTSKSYVLIRVVFSLLHAYGVLKCSELNLICLRGKKTSPREKIGNILFQKHRGTGDVVSQITCIYWGILLDSLYVWYSMVFLELLKK